jgi:hypothetical protein
MPVSEAFAIMQKDLGAALDPVPFSALQKGMERLA